MHDRCEEIVRDIVERMGKREFRSETDVRRGIVDPLLQALGWPVSRPRIVEREYQVEDGRVDYALCPKGKPLVFLEAKRPRGVTDAGRKQLFRYCTALGVPIAVLTDGREWHFYLLLRRGTPDERRLPPFDLSADPTEACTKLRRYLEYRAVTNEKNIESATRDLEQVRFDRACESVWRGLVEAPSPEFREMFAERVWRKVPKRAGGDVAEWIRNRARKQSAPATIGPPRPFPAPPPVSPDPISRGAAHWVSFRGQTTRVGKGIDVLVTAFTELAKYDPEFCRRYGEEHQGRHKRRVARTRREIQPNDPDLRKRCRSLPGGWWIDSNISNTAKIKWIRQACEVAGVKFGQDLRINIPGRFEDHR